MTSILRALIPERRNLDASKFGLATDETEYNRAGVIVNQDSALSLSAVYGAVRLLSNDIGNLPLDSFRSRLGQRTLIDPAPLWIEMPNQNNPNETGVDHFSQVVASLVLDGNAFVLVLPSVYDPVELHVLDPRRVKVEVAGNGAPSYVVHGGDGLSVIDTLTPLNCLHVTLFRKPGASRGLSSIEAMKQGIGRGIAAEEAGARFFGQGSIMGGIVEYPPEAGEPDPEQVKELLKGLNRRHRGIRNAWALGALTAGAKFHELTVKPSDSQLIETEEWTLEQFARTLGIPPSMLGSQKPGAVAYASIEQRAVDYSVHAVVPVTIRIEKAYSRLLPRGSYVKFNIRGLLRGDQKSRYEAYQVALNAKFVTRDEVRAWEDLEPFGDERGGLLETPNNNAPAKPAPAPATNSNEPHLVLNINEGAIRSESPVTVNPAAITVEPANVTVNTPDVRVDVPPSPPPDVIVHTPEVRVAVPQAEKRAVRRQIKRDAAGLITEILED